MIFTATPRSLSGASLCAGDTVLLMAGCSHRLWPGRGQPTLGVCFGVLKCIWQGQGPGRPGEAERGAAWAPSRHKVEGASGVTLGWGVTPSLGWGQLTRVRPRAVRG